MIKTIHLLAIISMSFLNIANAEIYQSTNSRGEVLFSDVKTANSKPVKLPINIKQPVLNSIDKPEISAQKPQVKPKLQPVKIVSPTNNQTFHNNNGDINVGINQQADLFKEKGVVRLYLDGKFFEQISSGNDIQIHNLDRGTHTLQVKAFSKHGKLLSKSAVIVIYLHKASILIKAKS